MKHLPFLAASNKPTTDSKMEPKIVPKKEPRKEPRKELKRDCYVISD